MPDTEKEITEQTAPASPVSEPEDAPKLDRRTAIAQARAIRREAAAKEQAEKAQAAETANTILENAEPEPPKAPLHKQTAPQPVSNTQGRFAWLDDLKKPAVAKADADEIVAQLLAESQARAERAAAAQSAQDAKPKEAIIEQIVAEAKAAQPDADEEHQADAIVAQVLANAPRPADSAQEDEQPDTEPDPAEDVAEEPDSPAEEETAVSEEVQAGQDDTAAEPDTENNADTSVSDDTAAEEPVPPRTLTHEPPALTDAEAADQLRKDSKDAKAFVKRASKKANRLWKKEAGQSRAGLAAQRTGKAAAKWNIAACLLLLFGVTAGMFIFERPTVSMEENRTLATLPEFSVEGYLDGSYTNGVSEYYNDTVPFRSTFKVWIQNIRKLMGLSGGAVLHGGVPTLQNEPEDTQPAETTAVTTTTADPDMEVTTTAATQTTPAQQDGEEPVQGGEISHNILIVDKRGIMLFGGWETMGEPYARVVNRFKEAIPEVDMYSMVVPTPCSFYTPEDFQYLITSEKKNIDHINSCLVDVTPVDAYGALERHTDEQIFMRTDHHWSSLGAFYAAEEFSAVARVPFARIEEYDKQTKEGYVGTLYGYSNDIILKENPEPFSWYIPHANFRTTYYNRSLGSPYESSFFMNLDNTAPVSWYMVYMAGDDHVVQIDTDVHNGRKLCVIKDSYGNALIPWLTSSFEEIYVIDMRFFKVNAVQFIRDRGVTDVLFAMNSFSANGDNALKIDEIRTQ